MRVVVVWAVLSLGVAALAGHDVDNGVGRASHVVVLAVFCAAATAGVASSTALGSLRRKQVAVDAAGPPWGAWRRAPLPVIVGTGVGVVVGVVFAGHTKNAMTLSWWSLVAGIVVARLLSWNPTTASPVRRQRWRWVLLESALPSALIAGGVGAVVGHVRFGEVDVVAPGALARTLAGTILCYLMLATAGFIKTMHEAKSGLVVVDEAPIERVPNPLFVGLLLAAVVALAGPWLLPSMPGDVVWIVKAVVGVVVGGGLSLLGALMGHARARS